MCFLFLLFWLFVSNVRVAFSVVVECMHHLNPSAPRATRYPEDENCPGYGGNNKTNTYKPARICGGSPSDVPSTYRGGFGAPADFKVANFGSGGATGAAIPAYARASPVIDEVIGAVEAGANTFR